MEFGNDTIPAPLVVAAKTLVSAKRPLSPTLVAFITLEILGAHILLPFLLLTFFVTPVKRNVTLVNLFVAFVITGIVMCLLFYAGEYTNKTPHPGWCQAQASLAYAVAPMDGTAVLCLLWHVHSQLRVAQGRENYTSTFAKVAAVVPTFAPYIVFLGFALGGVYEALHKPKEVKIRPHPEYFCTLADGPYSWATTIVTAGTLLASLGFIAIISWKLVKTFLARRRGSPVESSIVLKDVSFILRVVIYGFYIGIGFVLTASSVPFPSDVPDMFSATVPVFLGLLFGSQKDILDGWRSVFKRTPRDEKDEAWTKV